MIDAKFITFLTLCELKSYTKTAETLYVTQPTVTHHISQLEKNYNIKLFTSSSKNFSLTKQGKLLYDYALNLKALDAQFENMINSLSVDKIKIRLAAPKSVYSTYLDNILPYYFAKNKDINLEVLVMNLDEIQEALVEGRIDAAIVDMIKIKKGFATRTLYKTKVYLLANLNSDIGMYKNVIFSNLIDESLIVNKEEIGKMDFIEKELAIKNRSIKEVSKIHYIESLDSILGIIQNNDFIYFAYDGEIKDKMAKTELTKLEVSELKDQVEFNLIYNKGHLSSKNIEKMADEFEKIHKELNNLKYNSSFK